MVRDVPSHVVVFLVNVPVENRHVLKWHQGVDNRRPVTGCPIPIGCQVKQWAVRQNDDSRVVFYLLEEIGL